MDKTRMWAGYASEKFSVGVAILAEGREGIKERLLEAYRSQVTHGRPPDDVSTETAERIRALDKKMTREPDRTGHGTIAATVDAMSEDEAVACAHEIVELASVLRGEVRDMGRAARASESTGG